MLRVLSLCDGLSGGMLAFRELGIDVEYHAVEIDPHARKLSDSNFPEIIRWGNDVEKITKEDIEFHGPFDWIIFGTTCVSLSVAGRQEGFQGKSKILFNALQVLEWCYELNPNLKFLSENVKMKKEFLDQYDSAVELYYPGKFHRILINSSTLSAQKRERYYWTNFQVDLPTPTNEKLSGIIEINPKNKITLSPKEVEKISKAKVIRTDETIRNFISRTKEDVAFAYSSSGRGEGIVEDRINLDGKSNTLVTGEGCGNGYKSLNVAVTCSEELEWRKLSIRECARLQKIPDNYSFDAVSKTQAYKAIGNSWTVSVISHIFKYGLGLEKSIEELL